MLTLKKIDKVTSYLRVLMVKWPDIWKPTFWGQFIFDRIIKSTHLGDIPKAKSWNLGPHTVPWGLISISELKRDFSRPLK